MNTISESQKQLREQKEIEQKTVALKEYATTEMNRYIAYHNHKESVAYLAVGIYVAATGSLLMTNSWPPLEWGAFAKLIACALLFAFWFGLRWFLRYQLHRRRWAAMRLSGCSDVLAKIATGVLPSDELVPVVRETPLGIGSWESVIDFSGWALVGTKLAIEPPKSANEAPLYPKALVDTWAEKESGGDKVPDSISHERFIGVVCMVLLIVQLVVVSTRQPTSPMSVKSLSIISIPSASCLLGRFVSDEKFDIRRASRFFDAFPIDMTEMCDRSSSK